MPTEDVFAEHRELLFSVVYNLLASIADTEDVLQETWLSWSARIGRPGEEIRNPRAYLVRIAVNHALARQAAIRRRKETYVGPWLPEPLVPSAEEPVLRGESVSMAVLVVLETLTPLERAVFVLHEVFGYGHTEIAGILDRKPAAVRQLAHRAREHVQARRPRFETDAVTHAEVTARFVAAAQGGDWPALMELLAPDVTLWTDGGGKVQAAGVKPIDGRDKVLRALTGYARRANAAFDITVRPVNGVPTIVVFDGARPHIVLSLDLDAGRVRGVYALTNPDKLSRVRR